MVAFLGSSITHHGWMGWSLRLGLTRGRYRTTLNTWSHVFSDMPTLAQSGTKASSQPAFSMPPISIAPFQPNSFGIFITCCFAAGSFPQIIISTSLNFGSTICEFGTVLKHFTIFADGSLRWTRWPRESVGEYSIPGGGPFEKSS